MIKQLLRKRAKIAFGFLNTYIRRKGQIYDDTKWWDDAFYTDGVSDRQTISREKSAITAKYHYTSLELNILRHLRNNGKNVHQMDVLDIGSGSGHWIEFYRVLGASKITGVDISYSSFKYLMDKYATNSNVEIYQGKALEAVKHLDRQYDIANAVGVMFHIVDDIEWRDTIQAVANALKDGGLFIIGGHFGLLDGLNVQIDKDSGINKRLRSKRRWVHTLKEAGFRDIKVYRNNAYLWINDSLPENNLLVATK